MSEAASEDDYVICPACGRRTLLADYCMYCGAELKACRLLRRLLETARELEAAIKEHEKILARLSKLRAEGERLLEEIKSEQRRIMQDEARSEEEMRKLLERLRRGEIGLREYLAECARVKAKLQGFKELSERLRAAEARLRMLLGRCAGLLGEAGRSEGGVRS